jgi:transposase
MDKIQVQVKKVDVMPLVKHYIDELNLYNIFQKHLPKSSTAVLEPAQVLCMLIMNIICAGKPLYQLEEWVAEYTDGLTEEKNIANKYNDDKLGRTLDELYEKDRATIMTEVSSNAIRVHELETNVVRNDSTSITFTGAYDNQDENGAVKLAHGFNKDHRPDCKQIVFGLNVTDDGYVPLSYTIFDGNTTDDKTHIPNWESIREFLSKEDFLYIADSKLCADENLSYIDNANGSFITILPRNRKEIKKFYEYLEEHEVNWQLAYQEKSSRKQDEVVTYQVYEGEKHHSGYRIIWVLSSPKKEQDRKRREHRLEKVFNELSELESKLNQYYLKTQNQIEQAVNKICKGSKTLLDIKIIEEKEVKKVQIGRGKPGPKTKYKEVEQTHYRLEYSRNEEVIEKQSKTDGIFPLITNTGIEPCEVLRNYKKQPYLEKRMYTTKSILDVAPVFLKRPERIEALMFLYFVALMIVSLIERRIRKNLEEEAIESLPIRPQGMKCKKPTWNNIKYFYRNVHIVVVKQNEKIIESTIKGMTENHLLIARLLDVPTKKYLQLRDWWWEFS